MNDPICNYRVTFPIFIKRFTLDKKLTVNRNTKALKKIQLIEIRLGEERKNVISNK